MRTFLVILGLSALIAILYWWDCPERATLIVLALTLVALIVYAYDTNRIAKQFRCFWIADLFKNCSSRLDAVSNDLKGYPPFDLPKMEEHKRDIDQYLRVLIAIFPDKNTIAYLKAQESELKKRWSDAWVGHFRGEAERDGLKLLLKNFQEEMQERIGKLP